MTETLTRDEYLVLDWLGASWSRRVDKLCDTHKPALDKLVDWRLAVLVAPDRVGLTDRGRALLKRLGPWEPEA